MFFDAKRLVDMRAMILAETAQERKSYLDKLEEYQYEDMLELFTVMDGCLLYTSPSPRDQRGSRMPSSA